MYMISECDAVCKEYSKMVKHRSKKLTKIWLYVFAGYLGVMIILPMIPDFLDKDPGWVLYIIYGGMAFVGLSIALLISIFSISDVPAFDYLYKEIYNKLNQERGTFYKYASFEKEKFEFNINGGIFPRTCRTAVKKHVSGISPNDNTFDIFDVTLVTGGGKNKQVHFSGIYFVVKHANTADFQLRSHSRPHLKGVKYIKNEDVKDIKVYLREGNSISNIEYKFIDTLERLNRNLKAKKIYLSLIKDEIHFAYVPKVPIRKQYDLTVEKINKVYTAFLEEIRIIDELAEASDF